MAEQVYVLYKPVPTTIDGIVLDASISETHSFEAEATSHPVEGDSPITDHVRPLPDKVTIEGLFSNTPSSVEATNRAAAMTALTTYENEGNQVAGAIGYADACLALLIDLRDNPRLVEVSTMFRTYKDMVLTSLQVPRDAKTGDAIRFTATFQHVRTVSNKFTTVPITQEPKAKAKKSQGTTEAKPVTSAAVEERASTSYRMLYGSDSDVRTTRSVAAPAVP